MSNGRDDLVQLRKLVPKQASENVICQKEWSWRRKLKRQMRCLPMISCPPRRSLTRCGTGWARPSTASVAASRPTPPATPRRLPSCWQWWHDRCQRSARQSGFMRDAARCATGRRRFGRTRAPRFPRCGKSTYARVR